MTKTVTDVAVTSAPQLPADLADEFLAHAGEGANYDASELVIPFIRLAQKLTPHLDKKKPEFIRGLEEGFLYNTVTHEFWPGDTGLTFVIAYQKTSLLTFRPRTQGGGFRGELSPDDPILLKARRDENNRELLPDGLELVRSDQHFGLVVISPGVYAPAVIDMKSTQRKVSARLKTQINLLRVQHPKTGQLIRPPLFGTMWQFMTVEESNDKGDFYNYRFEPAGMVTDRDLFMEAKTFRENIEAGRVKTVPEESLGDGAQRQASAGMDDEIPF